MPNVSIELRPANPPGTLFEDIPVGAFFVLAGEFSNVGTDAALLLKTRQNLAFNLRDQEFAPSIGPRTEVFLVEDLEIKGRVVMQA